MKKIFIARALLLAALTAAPLVALAAEDQTPPNRIGLSYRAGFNITAKIRNLGSSGPAFSGVPAPDPGPATGGVNHNYDDGYNRVKDEGNVAGLTWNWGYASAGQIVGDNVVMSRSLPGDLTRDFDGDPQHGAELTYSRRLGRVAGATWGFEVGFGYLDLDLRNNSSLNPAVLAVDAYPLGGLLAPTAGFTGSSAGPGPLISDAPARADTFLSRIDGTAWSARVGPYLEFPFAERFAVSISGGFALLYVDSDFQYQESSLVSGVQTELRGGAGSHNDTLLGGYVGVNLSVSVCKSANLFVGAQYQHVENFKQRVGDKQAEIDFGKTIFATIGLSCSF